MKEETDKTINVFCFVTPTAEVFWIPQSKGEEYLKKVVAAWKDKHPELSGKPIMAGMTTIVMCQSVFDKIPSNNSIQWPEG